MLRASDEGGIPMHSNMIGDQQITAMKVEVKALCQQIPEYFLKYFYWICCSLCQQIPEYF